MVRKLRAAETSLTMIVRRSMREVADGCDMRHSVCIPRWIDSIHTRNITRTVKDACELAEKLEVQNLLLYHTEDKNITHRKELYVAEGKRYYSGNLHVPDDLEKIRF